MGVALKTRAPEPTRETQFIRIRFAVTRFKFPDRQQIFPALVTREFRWQAIEFSSESRGALAISSPKSANFPVFSRGTGKLTGGDRFADDCFHRHNRCVFVIFTNKAMRTMAPLRPAGMSHSDKLRIWLGVDDISAPGMAPVRYHILIRHD
jgi:hypothetical protein